MFQRLSFECQNFFTFTFDYGFSVVYDYMFFCALPPVLRPQWATKMHEVVRPHGLLIVCVSPIGTGSETTGPPYPFSEALVSDLLAAVRGAAWEIVYSGVPFPSQPGDHELIVWRRGCEEFAISKAM
ncbi:hypothetical protein DL93DRAFT_1453344 [Clavulina sp. PMI_390]|nr:hypothetical protein DL93DRAFT_1453344 [Clavulina sp. PMI_390]